MLSTSLTPIHPVIHFQAAYPNQAESGHEKQPQIYFLFRDSLRFLSATKLSQVSWEMYFSASRVFAFQSAPRRLCLVRYIFKRGTQKGLVLNSSSLPHTEVQQQLYS